MKYLKYFLTLVVVALVLSTSDVYAQSDSFYEGELVEGAYLKKFRLGQTTGKYEQMRIFRRSSDHQAAYCIELWSQLNSGQLMDGYTDDYAFHARISNATWERIQLIAYYGYEYKDHTSDNWYAASQFLIWKTLEPDSTIYFTDTLNGNQVPKFEEEMKEIEKLVLKHRMLPSFANKTHSIDAFINQRFFDTNKVLDDYTVTTSDPITYHQKNNHTINLTMDYIGTATFQLTREDTTRQTLLYVSPSSQNLIVRGNFPKITTEFKVQVETGKIIFKKVDKDTQESKPQGDASFLGTTYEIYTKNHKFKKTIEIKDDQPVVIEPVPYGIYFIRELQSGQGYQLDPKEYTVSVHSPEVTITREDEVYKGKIKLQKYYEFGTSLKEEEGAEFEIYNSKNQLVDTVKTDTFGQVEIVLPYGTYRFHQIRGKNNYHFIDDFFVSIKEEQDQEYQFIFKNEPMNRYLKVIKKDQETGKEIILGKASFRIKNLDTSEYVKQKLSYPNGEMIDIFTTNEQGFFITAEPLPIGNYQLEEVETPDGYFSLDKPFFFQISKDSNTVSDPNYGQIIVIEVYNQPKTGLLTIRKQGEFFQVEQGQFSYEYQPLENINFSVYAEEDIFLGDGTLLYSKGDLIGQKATNSVGKIDFSLPIGKYSVLEITFLDSYIKNEKKYFVEISSENLNLELCVYNYLKKGSLMIHKKDSVTGNIISDTYFAVYTKEGEKIATIVTDQNGIATLDSIPVGEYYVEEVKSNLNYVLDPLKVDFKIEDKEQVITLDLLNEPVMPPKTSIDEKQVKSFLCLECIFEIAIGFIIICWKPILNSRQTK